MATTIINNEEATVDFEVEDVMPETIKLLLTNIEEEHEIVLDLDADVFDQFEEPFVSEILLLPPIEAADEPLPGGTTDSSLFVCDMCSKKYKMKVYFDKHILQCDGVVRRQKSRIGYMEGVGR